MVECEQCIKWFFNIYGWDYSLATPYTREEENFFIPDKKNHMKTLKSDVIFFYNFFNIHIKFKNGQGIISMQKLLGEYSNKCYNIWTECKLGRYISLVVNMLHCIMSNFFYI